MNGIHPFRMLRAKPLDGTIAGPGICRLKNAFGTRSQPWITVSAASPGETDRFPAEGREQRHGHQCGQGAGPQDEVAVGCPAMPGGPATATAV
ncbi:hypothetical protein [Streptomyces sp. NPDC058291]|uniref:hypothetical protein n=1 Tax=Streptomyces sp. NPDC058291 TaxID=3346427 RepID=UPI0036E1E699